MQVFPEPSFMEETISKIIENGVIEAIFEPGWVEQSPDEFVEAAKSEIFPYFKKLKIQMEPQVLYSRILEELSKKLGDEFDVNIYRLKFFPAEKRQEFDI